MLNPGLAGSVAISGGGTGDGALLDGVSSSIKATVLDLASANPLTVAITDGTGNQITSFGGGTQYTEGDTDASITGTAFLMEGAANALVAAQGTVADGLLVNLGANNDVTATQSGTWTVQPGNTQNTTPWLTKEVRSGTATQSTVADTASSTTILASNANRLGASVSNDSSAVLYLLVGSGTASATNYTVRMTRYSYYETPFGYTGALTGIWATDPGDGAARVTEYT